jgi:stringent starvation protein B
MGFPDRPSKQEAFLALLKEGWTSLHLDARRPGVVVPAHLKNEAHLVLQYGHDLPIPIPDLVVDDDGVTATLSFSRTPHRTLVPWSAVYVVASDDGRGVLYHEDIPRDVSVIAARSEGDLAASMTAESAPPERARALRAVPLDSHDMNEAVGTPAAMGVGAGVVGSSGGPRRRRRPQLRLVK